MDVSPSLSPFFPQFMAKRTCVQFRKWIKSLLLLFLRTRKRVEIYSELIFRNVYLLVSGSSTVIWPEYLHLVNYFELYIDAIASIFTQSENEACFHIKWAGWGYENSAKFQGFLQERMTLTISITGDCKFNWRLKDVQNYCCWLRNPANRGETLLGVV